MKFPACVGRTTMARHLLQITDIKREPIRTLYSAPRQGVHANLQAVEILCSSIPIPYTANVREYAHEPERILNSHYAVVLAMVCADPYQQKIHRKPTAKTAGRNWLTHAPLEF